MIIRLLCPDCDDVIREDHEVLPWQWERGKFNGISVTCQKCYRMELFKLGDGFLFEPDKLEKIDDQTL